MDDSPDSYPITTLITWQYVQTLRKNDDIVFFSTENCKWDFRTIGYGHTVTHASAKVYCFFSMNFLSRFVQFVIKNHLQLSLFNNRESFFNDNIKPRRMRCFVLQS